jgi:hypothetical protein
MVADDLLVKSIDHDLYEAEDLELEHLISQLTLCAPAANVSVDELQDFRRVLDHLDAVPFPQPAPFPSHSPTI